MPSLFLTLVLVAAVVVFDVLAPERAPPTQLVGTIVGPILKRKSLQNLRAPKASGGFVFSALPAGGVAPVLVRGSWRIAGRSIARRSVAADRGA